MRIVHISDFHIESRGLEDLKNYVIKPLIKDLAKYNSEKKIDMIAFSGDLVDKGGMSFNDDIELAFLYFQELVIEPIAEAIKLPLEHFFFVPGNHDVVHKADKEVNEKGLLSILKNAEKVNNFIDSEDTDGIKRILPFKSFERDYYQNFSGEFELSNFQSTFKFEAGERSVGVSCFNTAWRCYDSKTDYQNIILGERQITRSRDLIEDCDIKIGIIHHPLDELAMFESKQIESMLIKDYDILFYGHVHEGSNWSKTNLMGSTIISVAPSNWTTNVRNQNISYANGYAIVDFTLNSNVEISHRRYSHVKESYVANTDLGDDFGKTNYLLPKEGEIAKKEDEYKIIEKIKEVHLDSIDQHLISYETDTNAPKKIEDMFVMPRIIQKEEEKVNVDLDVYSTSEKKFSIEDICNSEENLLLVGVKEAGKTILMDKILIELTKNFNDYLKIPISIDLENMTSNSIETLISKYLNIGILEIKNDILVNHRIVLLIDNLKFESKYKSFLRNLEDFIQSPNVSVIANCTSNTEEEIPVEAFDYNLVEFFKPAFIQSFQTKEIRELMGKWFSNNTNFYQDSSKGLEKIIDSFSGLNIPRTPMAVSMFLWIIEKQENYAPINNAQMLENFLERLFAKTSNNEIYSSDFNYRNKERLLTEIALYMYKENHSSYRISYEDLRRFIYENLKVKMFDFNEEKLLKEFVNKGIFSVEKEGVNKFVKFKFTCFFQFFLMKNIDINEEFKAHVLSEENYLHFVDELDYYSGLKVDDAELLSLVIDRMYDEYEPVLSKIEETQYTYDNPFETLSTIIDRISESDIEEITTNKQTDEEVEKEHDRKLASNSKNKIVKKDKEINPIVRLDRLWVLAAKVLKNTEEITVKDLKTNAFSKVIKCSMAFAFIYKYIITGYHEKRDKDNTQNDKDEQVLMISRMLPLIHQVVVYQTLGTGKLKIVIQDRIENILDDKTISDFEKFLYVFIYSDLNGKDKFKYMATLIKNVKRHYVKDMIFIKLLEYYYKKDTLTSEEEKYKGLLGNLITINDGANTERRDFHKKGRFISRLEKSKQEKKLLEVSS